MVCSIIFVSCSSGQANFRYTALRPKASGFSSVERLSAPFFSRYCFAYFFISSRFSVDFGITLTITATMPPMGSRGI